MIFFLEEAVDLVFLIIAGLLVVSETTSCFDTGLSLHAAVISMKYPKTINLIRTEDVVCVMKVEFIRMITKVSYP